VMHSFRHWSLNFVTVLLILKLFKYIQILRHFKIQRCFTAKSKDCSRFVSIETIIYPTSFSIVKKNGVENEKLREFFPVEVGPSEVQERFRSNWTRPQCDLCVAKIHVWSFKVKY